MSSRTRIVLIDDDDDLRETLALLLADEGYEVTHFARARDALTEFEKGGTADLILLDLMMADMNGWEFCKRRLDSPTLSKIPVVALTARRSYTAPDGVREVLHKPFEFETLLESVARVRDTASP